MNFLNYIARCQLMIANLNQEKSHCNVYFKRSQNAHKQWIDTSASLFLEEYHY